MIIWRMGTVVGIGEERGSVQEVVVATNDGRVQKAIHYTDVCAPLREGDRVKLNATADELGLGSGGYHFVCETVSERLDASGCCEPEADLETQTTRPHPGHIMKLRYTPSQRAVLAAEEPASPHHALFAEARTLEGMPVLIGELHSMVPVASVWIRGERSNGAFPLRVSYIMSDGGALPISFSRHAAMLREGGWLCGTVTYGHAYGGELETVNKFTALLAARHVQAAHIAIAAMGPGIVGTGTPFGHTATEMAELVHAVRALGGVPIVIPRVSFADFRMRHAGASDHLLKTLGMLTLARAIIPLPERWSAEEKQAVARQLQSSGCDERHDIEWVRGVNAQEVESRLAAYPAEITTMGRGLRDDPSFYLCVCAAAQAAVSRVRSRE